MGSGPIAVLAVDLNKDMHFDIISANNVSNNLTIRTGKGDGGFNALSALAAGMGPYALAKPDINNDTAPDVVAANNGGGDVTVYFNNGAGMLIGQPAVPAQANPRAVVIANINGDTYDDMMVANFGADTISVYLGDGQMYANPSSVGTRGGWRCRRTTGGADVAGSPRTPVPLATCSAPRSAA
jgi:hypothetical protein